MPEPSLSERNISRPIAGLNANAPLPQLCGELDCQVNKFLQTESTNELVRSVQTQTRASLAVIREALQRYPLSSLSLSYNGGKDCLVLLILFLSALSGEEAPLPDTLQSVYIVPEHPFPEVDDFVAHTAQLYRLDLARYSLPMKAAFEEYLHEKEGGVKAIFVGTRRTDPHGADLSSFDETDRGWPKFMRVHPVLEWRYAEIWTVPYCSLYDLGYTSLGGTTDTHPNPALRAKTQDTEGEDSEMFRPAYELLQDEAERLGRD
ncbi:MAG: 3'-phosphoadenosine 5'-phosphosulfate sulfotransferase [Piccolia ochrophora]|nr:MAG: 3'-phosphoadenosine 5'-phosphosulfate sulfotransferase [Piccolia ochrophora]